MQRFVLVALVLLCACSEARAPALEAASAAVQAPALQSEQSGAGSAGSHIGQALAVQRMVLREAHLRLRASDARAVAEKATRITTAAGGFVLNSTVRGSDGAVHEVELELRVEQVALDATLRKLRALGTVLEERVTGQDVTEEFVDVSARIAALRTLEGRLLTLVQNTGALRDLLTVENELSRVRSDIERAEGRVRYLEEHARMASVTVVVASSDQPLYAAAESVGSRLTNALSKAAEVTVTVTEVAIVAGGGLLPLGVLALAFHTALRMLRRRKAAV